MKENIYQMQYDKLYNKSKTLINTLKEREGLYIIDKNLNARVLFYYKKDILFFSDCFSIGLKNSINIDNEMEINNICESISNKFINEDYLRKSKMVKNIDNFIDSYMIESLIIKVNRLERKILKVISLEYYNELFLITKESFYKIIKNDDKLKKINVDYSLDHFIFNKNSYDYIHDLLITIYKYQDKVYPYDSKYDLFTDLYESDILHNDYTGVFVMCNIANEEVLSYQKISIGEGYTFNDIDDLLYDILNINKDYDIIKGIKNLAKSMNYQIQNKETFNFLN